MSLIKKFLHVSSQCDCRNILKIKGRRKTHLWVARSREENSDRESGSSSSSKISNSSRKFKKILKKTFLELWNLPSSRHNFLGFFWSVLCVF